MASRALDEDVGPVRDMIFRYEDLYVGVRWYAVLSDKGGKPGRDVE